MEGMGGKAVRSASARANRAKAIAYVGVSVALIAISSVIAIPLGPIPITLQMFAIPLIVCILPAGWAIAAVCVFLLLGLVGFPVFSGFNGGIGAFLGPTGGYLMGYVPGAVAAAGIVGMAKRMRFQGRISNPALIAGEVAGGLAFTLVAYLVGWAWYAHVAGIGLSQAFAVTVIPFLGPDVLKVALAVFCSQPVNAALKLSR